MQLTQMGWTILRFTDSFIRGWELSRLFEEYLKLNGDYLKLSIEKQIEVMLLASEVAPDLMDFTHI